MAGMGALVVLAFIGYLVWSRWLYHVEMEQMMQRGENMQPLVERAEEMRLRWGEIIGNVLAVGGLLWVGLPTIFGVVLRTAGAPAETLLPIVFQVMPGVLCLVAGLAVLRAHRRWRAEAGQRGDRGQ